MDSMGDAIVVGVVARRCRGVAFVIVVVALTRFFLVVVVVSRGGDDEANDDGTGTTRARARARARDERGTRAVPESTRGVVVGGVVRVDVRGVGGDDDVSNETTRGRDVRGGVGREDVRGVETRVRGRRGEG